MNRKLFLTLFLLPALILLTGLACDLPFGNDSPSLPDIDVDAIRQAVAQGKYLVQQSGQVATLLQSQGNLESLLLSPELGNVRWTGSVRAQMTVVRLVCTQVQGITPPEGLADAHQALLEVCGNCQQTVTIVLDGIDNLDQSAIDRALASGRLCLDGLEANKGALDALRERLDLGALNLPDLPLDAIGLDEADLPDLTAVATPLAPPTVNVGSNLRAGPGTGYDRVGGLREGTIVAVVGRNQAGDWLVIELEGQGRAWIAAFLVDNVADPEALPVLPAP